MEKTQSVSQSLMSVYRMHAISGVFTGLLTPIFALNFCYNSEKYNKAKWSGIRFGILFHVPAAALLYVIYQFAFAGTHYSVKSLLFLYIILASVFCLIMSLFISKKNI